MRGRRQGLILLAAVPLLAGCINGVSLPKVDDALAPDAETPPVPAQFLYCYGHGCRTQEPVALTDTEWMEVVQPLAAPSADAAAERAALALVVGRFEAAVGPKTGTDRDVGGTDIFLLRGQLDCVDEAVDTTRLLVMLQDAGLLRFHRAGRPVHRGLVGGSWTHMTAVMQEKGGRVWAVDSWFHDNGQPAEIVPLQLWLQGWHPGDPV